MTCSGIPDLLTYIMGVGYPEPGKTVKYDASAEIDPETVSLNGGFIVRTLVLSIDPYMRGRMRDPAIKSYSVSLNHYRDIHESYPPVYHVKSPFQLGKP